VSPGTWCAAATLPRPDYNGCVPIPRTYARRHHRHGHVHTHPASTQHGNTPLMLAAEKNRYHVVEALLASHADPRAKNYVRARLVNRIPPAHCAPAHHLHIVPAAVRGDT
jgi:hypothetical protein